MGSGASVRDPADPGPGAAPGGTPGPPQETLVVIKQEKVTGGEGREEGREEREMGREEREEGREEREEVREERETLREEREERREEVREEREEVRERRREERKEEIEEVREASEQVREEREKREEVREEREEVREEREEVREEREEVRKEREEVKEEREEVREEREEVREEREESREEREERREEVREEREEVREEREEVSMEFESFLHNNGSMYICFSQHGNRVYVDESQTLQCFPHAWYSQGHFISSINKDTGQKEGAGGSVLGSSDSARYQDDRTSTVHIQGKGTVATYMFEERANVCRYFEQQSGLWLLLPLQWEINMEFSKERVKRVMAALPGLVDQKEIMAALRQCNYDPEEVISVYLSMFGDLVLHPPESSGDPDYAQLHSLRALQEKEREVQELQQQLLQQQKEVQSVSQRNSSLAREVRYLSDVVQLLNRQLAQLEAENHDARQKIRSLKASRGPPPLRPPPPPPSARTTAATLDPTQLLRIRGLARELRVGCRSLGSTVRHLLGEVGQVLGELGAAVGKLGQSEEEARGHLEEVRGLYRKEAMERRSLYNKLQEVQGNVRVMCRCRGGGAAGTSSCVEVLTDQEVSVLQKGAKKRFQFDMVFPPSASQEAVFAGTLPLITSCVDGYNVCILAYGQTGSGKSYTMMGTSDQPGVNIRSIQELLHICTEKQTITYSLKVSMLEIYNDSLNDLLVKKNQTGPPLDIRAQGRSVSVPGLTQVQVQTHDDIISAMAMGEKNRKIGSTKMNVQRSHLVLTLTVEGVDSISGVTSLGTLTLCDLAGSERISKTEAKGERLVEAAAINKSLTALGQVFSALKCNALHVPFRNSKLTHLLQPCLSGEAKCCVFVTLSPDPSDLPETLSTLQFGSSIQQVGLGKAARNTAPTKKNP